MSTENSYFNKALSDFTIDFASGGAIRSMADRGLSIKQIKSRLDFPVPEGKIKEIVWKHYEENGTIVTGDPKETEKRKRIKYEKVTGSYGKTGFRQVKVIAPDEEREYYPCDFGKRIYRDRKAFEEYISCLCEDDRDYIMGLPWPLTTVWHAAGERMDRIAKRLGIKKH